MGLQTNLELDTNVIRDQLMESGIPRLAYFQTKPYMYMGPPHEIAFSWFVSVAEFYGLW